MNSAQELLNQLVGEQFSAVVFVQDYLQLQFDGPQLNVYSACKVTSDGMTTVFGNESFANHLIGQIAKIVESVIDNNASIVIRFKDHSIIEIPYLEIEGPEAIYFQGNNGSWGVWPA